MEPQLDDLFNAAVDGKRIPGAAAIVLDTSGKVLFSHGYGRTDILDPSSPPVTTKTPCIIYSCTKIVTCIATLQLIERGLLSFDDLVSKYVPEINRVQKIKEVKDDGTVELGSVEKDIKILHLITHTTGFTYDFFNHASVAYRLHVGQPPAQYLDDFDYYCQPLVHEPGEKFTYGINCDWLGWVVERITKKSLQDYASENIFKPLGLNNIGWTLKDPEAEKGIFKIHVRTPDGGLVSTDIRHPPEPKIYAGGHGLYSSCEDYAQILLTILNKGTHPISKVTVLEPETVEQYIFTDMLPLVGCSNAGVGEITTSIPAMSNDGTFMPGIRKGWSCNMVNAEDVPNGRSKGSVGWAGLDNCYYWMDPTAGKLGVVFGSILPFMDKDMLQLSDALERAVYERPLTS